MEQLNIPKKTDLKEIPTDITMDAVVIDLEVKTWLELTNDPEKKAKLKTPEGKVLRVKYDCDGFIRTESFPFTERPTTRSKYGKYTIKYGDFELGQKIKVLFDGEGRSDILLPK